MPANEVDLVSLFSQVTELLKGRQASLNAADSINHDHGDHMVENFKVITAALEQKRSASPAEQLTFASAALKQSSNTGSAQQYSQGLTRAAEKLQGQTAITGENALGLVQALLGRPHVDEFAQMARQEVPAVRDVTDQRLRLVLRQHRDPPNLRVDAVAQGEIDQAVDPPEGHSRLATIKRQRHQALATPSRHDNSKGIFHIHVPAPVFER